MRTFFYNNVLHYCLVLAMTFCLVSIAEADEKATFEGWEIDSPYNKYYNFKERDSLKGKMVKFTEVTPLPGMAPGTAFILEEGDEKITVHLCPVAYSSPSETGIRKGVKTKVKGCWAVIDGQDVFLAAKVKQGDNFEFKVRLTKDGKPFWSMSPEELSKELATN
ncbi:MAG: hypothetical protein WBB19_20295 [Desulforhopalus sp.]